MHPKAGRSEGVQTETPQLRRRMRLDQRDPRKAFLFGVLFARYDLDPGYHPSIAREVMDSCGIDAGSALLSRIEVLTRGSNARPAYDAFQAISLARAAAAIGMLSVDESWTRAASAGRLVQEAYDGWMSYGMGYVAGHLEDRARRGDEPAVLRQCERQLRERLTDCSQRLWSRLAFAVSL